jgi:hypothetical protein
VHLFLAIQEIQSHNATMFKSALGIAMLADFFEMPRDGAEPWRSSIRNAMSLRLSGKWVLSDSPFYDNESQSGRLKIASQWPSSIFHGRESPPPSGFCQYGSRSLFERNTCTLRSLVSVPRSQSASSVSSTPRIRSARKMNWTMDIPGLEGSNQLAIKYEEIDDLIPGIDKINDLGDACDTDPLRIEC